MPVADNPLSKREQEILTLVARGLTNQEIARELVISPNTVKVHLRNVFDKLEAASRTDAIVKAAQAGWIQVPGLEEEGSGAQPTAPPPALAPLPRWQRVYFFVAALVVALALLGPGLVVRLQPAVSTSDLTDAGLPRLGIPPRAPAGRWEELARLPTARSRLALARSGDLLYAVGGETAQGVTGALEVYDPQTNRWLVAKSKPTPVANVQAAAVNGRIYVPGGSLADGSTADLLEVYDAAADTWQSRAAMPQPLAGYALAELNGNLYVFGGWNGSEYVDDVLVYDTAHDRWQSRGRLPTRLGFAAAAPVGDRIMVAGGMSGERELSQCALYDPQADRWDQCAELIAGRGGLSLVADGSSVYAIGGGWIEPVDFNERYDSLTDTWSSISSPIAGQWRNLGAAALGSVVYAVGGWSGDYLDAVEGYQGPFRAFFPLGSKGQ